MRHIDALYLIAGPPCSAHGPAKPLSAVRFKVGASRSLQPRCAISNNVFDAKTRHSSTSWNFLASIVEHNRTARICQRYVCRFGWALYASNQEILNTAESHTHMHIHTLLFSTY